MDWGGGGAVVALLRAAGDAGPRRTAVRARQRIPTHKHIRATADHERTMDSPAEGGRPVPSSGQAVDACVSVNGRLSAVQKADKRRHFWSGGHRLRCRIPRSQGRRAEGGAGMYKGGGGEGHNLV